MFKIQRLEFSRFLPYVTSRRHRDRAVSFEKKGLFLLFLAVWTIQVLGEVFMCMYTSSEGKVIALLAKVSSRCFHWFLAAMLVSLRRAPTWRLHTELYKFAWNVLAINSRTVYRTDLRLGEAVYLLVFYNICNSYYSLIEWFPIYFLMAWQWKTAIVAVI